MTSGDGAAVVRCVGCGARVPDTQGPTHAYMRASPGCWMLYGQLCAHSYATGGTRDGRIMDCYAVQHPGGAQADGRQRASVAVHLTALCLDREFAIPPERVSAIRGRMSRTVLPRVGLGAWPYLAPPSELGEATVVDVEPAALAASTQRWAAAAWSAWVEHHAAVREWATAALGGRG